jgi:homocysteine S-methyltransferase
MNNPTRYQRLSGYNQFVKYLIKAQYVLFPGGLGTTLQLRGAKLELPLWSAGLNLTNTDLIQQVHREFAFAGSNLLSANTFRTQEERFLKAFDEIKKHGLENSEIGKIICRDYKAAAKQATRNAVSAAHLVKLNFTLRNLFIAGSFGPIGGTHEVPEIPFKEGVLLNSHRRQVENILNSRGVDILLPEAAPTLEEAQAMAFTADENIPFILGLSVREKDGKLFDGATIQQVVTAVKNCQNLIGFSINCSQAEVTGYAIDELLENFDGFVGAYANGGGEPATNGAEWVHKENDRAIQQFVLSALSWREKDPSRVKIFGGCCGATPDYIRALSAGLKQHVREYRPDNRRVQVAVGAPQLGAAVL